MIYFELFLSFIYIGLFSFGGGYAVIALIQSQIVEAQGWITFSEFTDIITISEMTPGPLSINAATFVGTKLASFPGAVVATIGFVLPAIIIVLSLGFIYNRFFHTVMFQGIFSGVRPAVIAMVASAGLTIGSLTISNGLLAILLFLITFILLQTKKLSPIVIILLSGVAGIVMF